MSESKHTPGPWYTDGSKGECGLAVCWRDQEGDEVLIADAFGIDNVYDIEDPRAQANARLIAAAPEMVGLLERCERKLSAYVGICNGDKELTGSILPDARALLSRIRGEAP